MHSQPGTSRGVSRPPSSCHSDRNSKLGQSQLQPQFSLSFKGEVTNEAKNPLIQSEVSIRPILQRTSHKPVQCRGKSLKIKSKLILIFFFLVVQNVVGKIDKETLRIEFRIDPIFLF